MKSSVTDECVGFLSRFSSRVLLLVSSIMWEIDRTSNLPLKGRKRNKSLKIQSTEITKLRSQGPAVFQENRHKLLCIKKTLPIVPMGVHHLKPVLSRNDKTT